MQTIGGTLYIGVGNSPGNEDGACVLSSTDGVTLVSEQELLEQGVHEIHAFGGELYVPGTDPFEGWDLGILYTRLVDGTWVTQRTLPLTIHSLGCWKDANGLYVVGGMHTGDSVTWKGRVLKSVDDGQTWNAVNVNDYRLYDVIGFDGRLYATGYDWTGGAYTQDLHVSADAGATWSKVAGVTPAIKPRLVLHGGDLIGVQSSFTGLFKVAIGGAVIPHSTPFTIANHWNVIESDGSHCYALASDGRVWRTVNFATWEVYTQVNSAISIKHWPGHGLMIGDMGTAARVWLS